MEEKKLSRKEIVFCCELIWGHVPEDTNWILQSNLFKSESIKILEKYPMLDKSFWEIHGNNITK
jgi:hypothetical protein